MRPPKACSLGGSGRLRLHIKVPEGRMVVAMDQSPVSAGWGHAHVCLPPASHLTPQGLAPSVPPASPTHGCVVHTAGSAVRRWPLEGVAAEPKRVAWMDASRSFQASQVLGNGHRARRQGHGAGKQPSALVTEKGTDSGAATSEVSCMPPVLQAVVRLHWYFFEETRLPCFYLFPGA